MKIPESKRILVADDDLLFRVKLSDTVIEAGHMAVCVDDGRGVIEVLEKEPHGFDLLMLDLQMPEIDGYEVLEWIKEHNLAGAFPILVVTGVYDPAHIYKRLKNLGAVGLITKALSPKQVIHKVNRLLFPDLEPRGKLRVPLSVRADFTIEHLTSKGTLLNLNMSGLFLHTTEELRTKRDIILTFTLPGHNTSMMVKGVVRWQKLYSGEKVFFSGAGITFHNLPQKTVETLHHFITEEKERLGLKD